MIAIKTIIKSAAFVTFVSVSERLLGFVYRIILSRSLGQEGVGIYQIGLSVFHVLLTIVCSGIPLTVSRLLAKYRSENNLAAKHSLISAAMLTSILFSLPLALIFFLGHKYLGFLFSDQRCMSILLIMLPSLVFCSVYSVVRGVFWGEKQFVPYSVVEFIEEVAMIVIGVLLIRKMTDVFDGAKRAAVALMLAYIISFFAATIAFFVKKQRFGRPFGFFKPLIASSATITATRTLASLVNSLIAIILPKRLIAAGYTKNQALSAFGMAFGMALPILFIPATIIGSLAVVLVPELAENYYKKHNITLKHNIEKALIFSITVACLLTPMLFVCGNEIGLIVFNSAASGKYISKVSVILLPMSVSMITTSMLNSISFEKQAFSYYLIGAGIMLLCLLFLTRPFGAYSLGIGLFLSYTVTSFLNLRLIRQKSRMPLKFKRYTACSIAIIIIAAIFGHLLKTMLSVYMSAVLSTALCLIIIFAISVALYAVFDLINITSIKGIIKKN